MKRSIIITLALIAAIAVPLCASSGWARGLGVLGLGGSPLSVSDDFNRADGALGANWTTVINGSYVPVIAYWHVVPSGGGLSAAIYTGSTFSADQKACADLQQSHVAFVLVRGVAASQNYYYVASDSGSLLLRKRVNGTPTTLATYTHPGETANVCISATGSSTATLVVSINGTAQSPVNDSSSPHTSGQPGVAVYDGWVDNFTANEL